MGIEDYVRGFVKLKRGSTQYGTAPHKPILLLTLLDLVEKNLVSENRFEINSDLVGLFHENWGILVRTSHQEDFTQPFFYLQNDQIKGNPFWFLIPKSGYSIQSHIKSIRVLAEVLNYGMLSQDLFEIIRDSFQRNSLRKLILESYFPELTDLFLKIKKSNDSYLKQLESYILNENQILTRLKVAEEEEVYVRNAIFKKWIPKIYNGTCAISGMTLVSTFGYSFIDACHIVPFRHDQNDKVTNGIALCPNLHRAFDRGILSIDSNFKVIVSSHISENFNHPYSLTKLHGKDLILPIERNHWPSIESLDWHRETVFKR